MNHTEKTEKLTAMARRVCLYILGVFILALGIVLNTKTGLGIAAIVSFPYAISEMTSLSLGNATTIFYIALVAAQLILYRKFTMKILLQVPFSFVMGFIVDFYHGILTFSASSLPMSVLILLAAIVLTAIGAYIIITMDLVLNPADGSVKTISTVFKKEFGRTKLVFDCSIVLLTVIVSYVFSGSVIGIGFGTILSAVTIGNIISLLSKLFHSRLISITRPSINMQ